MAISNLIAFFIILTTAVTLNAAGQVDIQTAEQAAEALRPIAGDAAFLLFSLGLIGTGLLAVPVLDDAGWMIGIVTVDDALAVLLPDIWQRRGGRVLARTSYTDDGNHLPQRAQRSPSEKLTHCPR